MVVDRGIGYVVYSALLVLVLLRDLLMSKSRLDALGLALFGAGFRDRICPVSFDSPGCCMPLISSRSVMRRMDLVDCDLGGEFSRGRRRIFGNC